MFHLNRKLFAYGFLSDLITLVHHTDRKPFAYSFLSGMVLLSLADRKLFRQEISGLRFAPLEMTERLGSTAFLTDRQLYFTANSQVVNNHGVNLCD